MSLIDWKDEFNVGNAAVDHEHKSLIALINKLHAEIDHGADHDDVVAGLGEIYAQIAAHFALEEKIMRDAAYLYLMPHKQDHEALLDQLADIMDTVDSGGSYSTADLSRRLEHWFSEHFRTHDARLHRQL